VRLRQVKKRLWRTFKSVVGEASTADTDAHTADDFAAFFKEKVDAVRASTTATPLYDVPYRRQIMGIKLR